IDPDVVRQLLYTSEKQDSLAALTPRENEVLEAMAEGLSNRGISERLFVSVSSVEKAISALFDKLGLHAGESTSRRVAAVLAYLNRRLPARTLPSSARARPKRIGALRDEGGA